MDDTNSIEKINEEYYGLEYEEQDDDSTVESEHPFDAEKIRIDQQMLSLKYVYDLMESGLIDTSPEFQRNKVWTERKRKSLLIESLMLRIPIPTFYFYEDEDSKFIVIDGQQRLTTIRDFINNKFKLSGLEYLHEECGNRLFTDLDVKYQQRIYRTQFAVNILDSRSPYNVIFDIFRRVNTGGVTLKPQEIRNAIAKKDTRRFLKDMANSNEFRTATRGRVKDDRMDAQELVLRFIAFSKLYEEQNGDLNFNKGDLIKYLDSIMLDLNKLTKEELSMYGERFKDAMRKSHQVFGKYAFRKFYLNEFNKEIFSNADIINKALFTSWSVVLNDPQYNYLNLDNISNIVTMKLAKKLTEDHVYNNALTQGTNSRRSINCSFNMAKEIIEDVKNND